MKKRMLEVTNLKGSPYSCGHEYGVRFAPMILGFFSKEIYNPDDELIKYAKRCWKYIEKYAPTSAMFMKGMAKGSGVRIEFLVLLTLHDEVVNHKHCTGFVTASQMPRQKKTIVAGNWDSAPSYFPWPGLLRLSFKNQPRTLTYHYPGIWASCGINQHGLALMWTGAYYPPLHAVNGVPTYVLIAEILLLETVSEVLAYLKTVRNAGSFIFLLGDASGDSCVAESIPGKRVVERSTDTHLRRANHFRKMELKRRRTRQDQKEVAESERRYKVMGKLLANAGAVTPTKSKAILTTPPHIFCCNQDFMTVDCLFAICEDRVLWTCRGDHQPNPWQCVKV